MTREDIANELADDGWCPDSSCEYVEADRGWLVTKSMFISDADVDSYIAEQATCRAEEQRDADRYERLLEKLK